MNQSITLVDTLKRCLKAEGKTYADLSLHLGLSESTIKRLLSEKQHISLARIEEICQFIGMEISDLVQKMQEAQNHLTKLTQEQEEKITQDLLLLLITICTLNRWTPQQITEKYHISDAECFKRLRILDELNIIDLLPNNVVKLRISSNFQWQAGGPIQRFFQEKVGAEFFNSTFSAEDECLHVLNGMLSLPSNSELQQRLSRIVQEFNDLNNQDATLPHDKRSGTTLVLAMRNWQYGLFEKVRKD